MDTNKHYKVFLVDDDIKTLLMIKTRLEKKLSDKVSVNIFAHGDNVIDKMSEKPDVVILDYHLNNIREDSPDGLEVLKKIKTTNPDTVVVMMSGQEDMDTALETIRHGAFDYIIKNEKAMQRIELILNKIIMQKDNS